jgi:hypothetical protein
MGFSTAGVKAVLTSELKRIEQLPYALPELRFQQKITPNSLYGEFL